MSNVLQFPGQGDPDVIAINFFAKVLPGSGLYCAAVKKQTGGFYHYFFENIEPLWEKIKEADRDKHTTYFCPASFSSNERTIEAVAEKQTLSLDIDYGPGHVRPHYDTFDEAKDALKAFCLHFDLPVPIIVKSGGGLHAHWPFKTPKSRIEWQAYADGLKAACIEFGLRADHSCTSNAACVYRPPGTLNRKLAVPRPVETDLEWIGVGPYEWPEQLRQATIPQGIRSKILPRPSYLGICEPSPGFPDHYSLANAETLADACGQYGRFRRTGLLPEPVWTRLIAGTRFVENGERIVHEWSKTDPRYKPAETQSKYDRAAPLTGPPLCKGFKDDFDPDTRAICLACPHLDVVKTPLQLGEKNEHVVQSRPDIGDFRVADISSLSVAPKKVAFVEWDKGEKGGLRPTYKNAAIAIGRLDITCRHDVFHLKKYVDGPGVGPMLDDATARWVREQTITRFRFDPLKLNVMEALERECERNPFDPVKDWLSGLQWDGISRFDRWLSSYVGADDTPLNRSFGRKVLLAAVRRVRNPGCKFDHLLVLEGPQGAGKSSTWRILAGDANFDDTPIRWDNPQKQQESAGGVWIHEVGELVGLKKADIEHVKNFLSRQNDRGRAVWDRFPKDQPRRCIFVGTVNPKGQQAEYLTDPTGARRFWPVRVGRIDLEALRRDRDQLWAEAAHYEAQGEALELPPELYAAATREQDLRRVADPWTDILGGMQGEKIKGKERIASADLMTRDLTITKDRMTPQDAMRLGSIMRDLGWDGPKTLYVNGRVQKGYER